MTSTSTATPTDDSTRSAQATSSGSAAAPAAIADAPCPTSAGVFGIDRTTATPGPHASCSASRRTPAAIERILRAPAATAPRQASATS